MFPIRLNVLSPEKKHLIKKMTRFQFFKNLLEIFLIVTTIIAMTLLGSQFVLQNYFSALTENIVSINSQHAEDLREIRQINHLLKNTHNIQLNYYHWTPLINDLSASIIPGITLESLHIDQTEKNVIFTGHAKTRELFLSFQESLEHNSRLEKIVSPISGLTKKEHIPFSISASLKK